MDISTCLWNFHLKRDNELGISPFAHLALGSEVRVNIIKMLVWDPEAIVRKAALNHRWDFLQEMCFSYATQTNCFFFSGLTGFHINKIKIGKWANVVHHILCARHCVGSSWDQSLLGWQLS